MKLAEIGFSEEFRNSVGKVRQRLFDAADSLEKIDAKLARLSEDLFRTRRLLLENARLMRKLIGLPGALHIADDEGESDANGRDPDEHT